MALPNLSDPGMFFLTAFVVPLDAKKETCCSDGLGLNYTLPMFNECKKKPHPNGSEVQTIPKLIPYSPADGACPKTSLKNKLGIPPGHRVCRFPDCESNPCQNGWCEETMLGYDCHCPTGFEGKNCDEESSGTVDTNTISTSDPESPSTPTSAGDLTAATQSMAATDSTLQSTFPASTSGPPMTTASTLQTTSPTSTSSLTTTTASSELSDATTVTPSDSTQPEISSTSTSDPPTTTMTTASTAPTDATTITPSESTLRATSPTSTSSPTTTTGSTTTTDAVIITPSDSTLPETSPTLTSGPPTTTASSAPTDATAVTPLDSTLPVTSSTSTLRPATTTGSSVRVFVTDAGAEAFFVSEMGDTLNFTSSIPSTSNPNYIKYDPTERHIYWSDLDHRCVFRANLSVTDREQITMVTAAGTGKASGIAIARRSRILYIAYFSAHKVTSMSIEHGSPLPGTETVFVNHGISRPRAMIVDEEEGFLYISWKYGIVRALLNATNDLEEIYHNQDLMHLTGLSIDLTRNPRRIFFSDVKKNRTFYKDVSSTPNSDTSSAIELTAFLQDSNQGWLMDVVYFSGNLYWLTRYSHGIGIMMDYSQTNRSYRVQEISQFESPRRMLITSIEP